MYQIQQDIPDHVPDALVYDYDFFATPAMYESPHWDVTKKLQAEAPPIFYTPRNGGHWVVTRQSDVVEMYRAYDKFSNNPIFNYQKATNPTRHLPLYYDPPEHTEARRIFAPVFTPGAINTMVPAIRALAIELIEEVQSRGHCNFVSEISKVFPTTIFLQMSDAPLDRRALLVKAAETYMHSQDSDVSKAGLKRLSELLEELVEQKRKTPGADLVSRAVTANFLGRPLTDKEMTDAVTFFFLAGLDTVASMLSFVMQFLARNPGHYRQLVREPELITRAVEELIRVTGVAMPERGVTEDNDFHGVKFKKGDRIVYLLQISGMNNPDVKDPFEVDFHREISAHLVFGSGPHRCLGSHLARVEIRVFLEEWVRRIPSFSIQEGHRVQIDGGTTWIPHELPLAWDTV